MNDKRLIIDNQTRYPTVDLLGFVQRIIREGKISNDNKQYCFLTCFGLEHTFNDTENELDILCVANKKSYRFTLSLSKARR